MLETPMLIAALVICSVLSGLILLHAVLDFIRNRHSARRINRD